MSHYLPTDVKLANPAISWERITDFGDRLRDSYYEVDSAIVWEIATRELPALKAFVLRIVEEEKRK